MFKDLFISYGRRESLSFVARLHQKLKLTAYEAWFDKVNIPDGEDYTARIHYGIESAHNFVYVMAARTLCSPYCLIELEYARFLGKRVIPINQAVIFQTENCLLSENEQQILRDFYRSHELIDPQIKTTQQVLERSLVLVGRTDWLDAKENISNQNCEELTSWAQSYENQWHKHESLEYLQTLELPQFGETIDSLDSVIERLSLVLERHKYYVSQHTLLTTQALDWARNQSLNHYLLVGKERQAAEEWLLVKFQEGEQAPCTPCDLLCDFIGESRKNAENRMTDCFICYDYADKETRNLVIKALARHAITTWRHDNDIQRGSKAEQAILSGIAGADNVLYFISPEALISEACNQELAHARELNKRIIPLLIKVTPNLPAELQQLQYLNFLEDQQHGFAELLRVLHLEHHYYEQHKMLLVRALEWRAGAFKTSFLLRGYNLENAKTWLRLNQQREQHPPTALHVEFITASEAAKERLGTEVFLSYSRKDGDFARKLNRALQESGKTVWFDQESISSGANFELELYKGIQNSDNFLFVISPDSATSPYCESEVNYAAQQGKRMVSVLCRETAPSSLPEVLKCINWIDFAQQEFDKQFPELIQTLELDREHAHQHTVLQQRANEWQENNCSNDFLLNISACKKAETWLKAATDKQPRATELQESYIKASREAIEAAQRKEQRRQRVVLGSVLMGLVIAIVLAAFAWDKSVEAEQQKSVAWAQKKEADKQTEIAKKNYTKARINSLVNIANQQIALGDYTRALRVAQEAYELNPNPQEPIPAVEQALSDAYNEVVLNQQGAFYKDSIISRDSITERLIESPKGQLKLNFQTGIVQLINLEAKIVKELKHEAKITKVQWLDAGSFILTQGEDNSVKLWDGNGVLIKTLLERKNCTTEETDIYCAPSEKGYLIQIIWLRDNKLLLIDIHKPMAIYHKLLLWDMQGNFLKHQKVESDTSLVFSKNGQHFVSFSENSKGGAVAKFWRSNRIDLPPSISIPLTCGKNGGCSSDESQLTPDGQKLISYDDLYIYIFTNKSKIPDILKKHKKPITALTLAPDGKSFASGDSQGEIIIWNVDGQSQKPFLAQGGKVDSITYSKDGKKLLSTHGDKTVKLWKIETDFKAELLVTYTGHQGDIKNAEFSDDEQMIKTSSFDNTQKLWFAALEFPLPPILKDSQVFPFPNDGNQFLISPLDGNKVYLWSLKDRKIRQSYSLPEYGKGVFISFIGISPDAQRFITYGSDKVLRVHKLENGVVIYEWSPDCSSPTFEDTCSKNFIYSKDGQFIVGSSRKGDIFIWKITGELVSHFSTGEDSTNSQVENISPDNNHIVVRAARMYASLWDFSGKRVRTLSDMGFGSSFSPDGRYLAITTQQTTRILSLTNENEPVVELKDIDMPITINYHPSGKYLITGSANNKTAKIWTSQGKLLRTLSGHPYDFVRESMFTENGDILTTSSESISGNLGHSTTRIWPSTKKIYEWAKNNKDIYQLTDADRKELGMIEE